MASRLAAFDVSNSEAVAAYTLYAYFAPSMVEAECAKPRKSG